MTPELHRSADLVLLALTVWREARGESRQTKLCVACSIVTRAKKGGWWGDDIPSVVSKPLQYSSLTAPRDPNLVQWPTWPGPSWGDCLEVADAAMNNLEANPVPGADSYHDTSISPPFWATEKAFVAQVGHMKFYSVRRDAQKGSSK